MQDILGESLSKLRKIRVRKTRMIAMLLVLSLVVSLDVFWMLRQPGLTLAGDADCGIIEHTHDDSCQGEEPPCTLSEHIHDIYCYSDKNADVETQIDWQNMFANYPYIENLRSDLVGIAKTQVGYTESKLNFQIGDDGVRRGYNRYGAWYGIPYTDWSAQFVSFCLHYAGAESSEAPGNTGANSMAESWKALGKYAFAGDYTPKAGDLVFFKDNTVGIVAETHAASIHFIQGDVEGAVLSSAMTTTDSSIAGWGITVGKVQSGKVPLKAELLDISKGPAVFIFAGESKAEQKSAMKFMATRTVTDIGPYLTGNGGSYFFTILDLNNNELPKDDDKNYIVEAGKNYKLSITFNSPSGIAPGTYQYQLPSGLAVEGGEGNFVLKESDGTEINVGSWKVSDTGLITMVFNEKLNNRSDIAISATLGIHFPEPDEPIDFDGIVKVTIKPPVVEEHPTVLTKWGTPNGETGKIGWKVKIEGHADSQIPGNTITDRVDVSSWAKPHSYTESDIAGGLTFGASDPNGGWHAWHVSADDPYLSWDENGWSYKMPETVICNNCGELQLGNEGWTYFIDYTSTPKALNIPGTFDYENKVTVDNEEAWGWSNFTHGETAADLIKNGSFVSDASGGAFLWEVQVTIPGRVEGHRAEYSWYISDEMRLLDESGIIVAGLHNDINLSEVTATYNGKTIKIPRIQDATDSDMFAWNDAWAPVENGISPTHNIDLLCRCQCTSDTCHWTACGDYWFKNDDGTDAEKGFCQCWTETQDMTFTFIYKTTDLSTIEKYGGLGYQVKNNAQLLYKPDANTSNRVADDDATVAIPNMFEKQLTQEFNGYTAHYKITVNEGKLVLTDGAPLTIHDVMSKTLVYISGSLVITAEDENGNITTLKQGVDYTVDYDGTGDIKDEQGNSVHTLDIVILRPQPVMYTLNYDTTLNIPNNITEAIKYDNSATITLWGEKISDNSEEKVYADINIAAKTYRMEIYKTCAESGKPLGGATFGLYNEQGGLITTGVTDVKGKLLFETNVIGGIILREHVLYYMEEISAPPGYQLDNTKYWFCFCNKTDATCQTCDKILAGKDAYRIPFEQIGKVDVTNQYMNYNLPATGGSGVYYLMLVSVIFVVIPLVYRFIRRRSR